MKRYGVPIIFALLVLFSKSVLLLFFSQDFSFHLIFIAVILSAWYGGLGPGVFATLLIGTFNDYLFIEPRFQFDYHSIASIGIFFLEGLLVSIIAEAKRQSDIQKDEFIGFASHELKNPLASISGFATLMQRKLSRMRQKELGYMAATIDKQAKRATLLINELLDITKIDANKLKLYKSKIKIYDFIKETIKEQRILSQSHRIQLSGKTGKKVNVDEHRLKQVIVNLLTNAIKYSPQADKIRVTVQDAKKEVVVSVQDFGIGIDSKNVGKVFDRFFRTDIAEKHNIQGLGLGLYICAQIIKKHEGRIWVESKKGNGSTFYIALPTFR